MRPTVIAGVGMTSFGRLTDRTFASLVSEATREACADANTAPAAIQMVYYANTGGGRIQGQESARGQFAVREANLSGVPLINVENACASGSTALNQAWLAVASGQVDTAIAIGAEKLTHPEKSRAFALMMGALDQTRIGEIKADFAGGTGSVFMDLYARFAHWYLDRSDATAEDFAQVAVKNHAHGALNPKAQYGGALTVDEVLGARRISGPLTLPMCAPMSDGAAAAIVTTTELAASWNAQPVRILATVIGSGRPGVYGELVPGTANRAYEMAGVGPADIDIVELHDAAAPAELIATEDLGLCAPGDASMLLRAGDTTLGGRLPINLSGGLVSKGHPIGATGIAQIVELADQLRGRCGARQAPNVRTAIAENAGSYIGPDAAVASVTVLQTS